MAPSHGDLVASQQWVDDDREGRILTGDGLRCWRVELSAGRGMWAAVLEGRMRKKEERRNRFRVENNASPGAVGFVRVCSGVVGLTRVESRRGFCPNLDKSSSPGWSTTAQCRHLLYLTPSNNP